MKTNWNEKSQSEKTFYIISIIFCLAAVVFAVLDLCTDWQYANFGWNIAFALYLCLEAKANWNKNHKIAILDLVLGILMVVVAFVTMFL